MGKRREKRAASTAVPMILYLFAVEIIMKILLSSNIMQSFSMYYLRLIKELPFVVKTIPYISTFLHVVNSVDLIIVEFVCLSCYIMF